MINPYGINNDGSACIVTLPNQDPEYGYAIISTFIASIIQERNNESNGKNMTLYLKEESEDAGL